MRFDPLKIAGLVEEVQIGFLRLNRNKQIGTNIWSTKPFRQIFQCHEVQLNALDEVGEVPWVL